MREAWRFVRVCVFALMFVLFLGTGMKTEASGIAQVQGLKQTGGTSGSVKIIWNAVIADDIRYKVELSGTAGFSSARSADAYAPEASFFGLSAGQKYYVRVTAYNSRTNDTGIPSQALEVVTAPEKSSTQNFRQTDAGATSITLKWDKNPGANAYRLEYYKDGNSSSKKAVDLGNVQTYTVKKLSKNSKYTFSLYPVKKSVSNYSAIGGLDKLVSGCPVLPGKVTGLTASYNSPTSSYLSLSWNKRESADGYQYQVYTASGKKDKKLLTGKVGYNGSNNGFSNNKLKKAQFLKVRIRGYVNLSGVTKYGSWSGWIYTSKQPEVKVENVKGGQKLTWTKVSGADSYTIQVSTQRASGYKTVKTVSGTSATVAKCGKSALKSGKTYYYTVVANKKVGKKTSHGSKTHCYSLVYR